MFPVMSQPSASPFHRPKKNMWRKPSLKSKQRMAQWKTRHAYSGSSQNISLEQSMNSTVALRSYPHPLSVQPRTPTPWSPYTSHQYTSSVPWMMGGSWPSPLAIQNPIRKPQYAAAPALGMKNVLFYY